MRRKQDLTPQSLPPVEWNPKKLADQRERFAAAFDREWDYTNCASEDDVRGKPRPGECSEHVIDFVSEGCAVGVRVIASREKQPGGEFIHISASLHHTDFGKKETIDEVRRMLSELLAPQPMGTLVRSLITAGGINHWFFEVPAWVKARVSS